jgi:hypothetical protein
LIFVDSNVPMYLVGTPHRHKQDARLRIREALAQGHKLLTDAEVLQEILHRYAAMRRFEAIDDAIDALVAVVDDVLPVTREDVLDARSLLHPGGRLSARDAIHLAVMRRHKIDTILSFDRGFDGVPGIKRLGE